MPIEFERLIYHINDPVMSRRISYADECHHRCGSRFSSFEDSMLN
jgi:hypothetical protein